MHLFLSPHLDDAVLSCGGLIDKLSRRGERVVVRTIMAGIPPRSSPETPLTGDLHARWQAGDNPVEARQREDHDALRILGAQVEHLDIPDCPYRVDTYGQPLYSHQNDLFGPIHPDDPALATQITTSADIEAIYAPLGAGGHVDHKIVCDLAVRCIFDTPLYFYEEYPYSADSGEAVRFTYDEGRQVYGKQAIAMALEAIPFRLKVRLISLSSANLRAKITAVACYKSQISTFWDDLDNMERRIRAYARQIAVPGAERLWFTGGFPA